MDRYDNIRGKGNRFTSTNQPPNRGRKPKLYNMTKKMYKISLDDWNDMTMYLMQCPKDEIKRLATDPATPIWVANICRALYKDTDKGITTTLQEITTRMWGRPGQSVDITSKGEGISREPISIEIIDSRDMVDNDENPDD